MNICDEGLKNLSGAIIAQAIRDAKNTKTSIEAVKNRDSAINFFGSDWFEELSLSEGNARYILKLADLPETLAKAV